MSKTVVIDFGHGLPDPGAVKYGQEYQYAASIGREVAKRLPSGVKVVYTRTTNNALDPNKGKDLNARCSVANRANADLFVSIHLNASTGTASGYETLVYSPNKEATAVHAEIKKVLDKHDLKDRGIKTRADVRVLNGTNMPALLLECLFIDNKSDMEKINNQAFFEEFCQAIADGICKAVGIEPQTKAVVKTAATTTPGTYRVFTGTFSTKESAEEAAAKIKAQFGFEMKIRDESK